MADDDAKAGWSMQFDMSGGMTPRTRATVEGGKKKMQLEKAKHDLKAKAAKSMMKLCDRDTQQNGIAEMQKICDELKQPELSPVIISVLCEFDGGKSAFARAQGAKMFGMFGKYHPAAVQQSMGKVVNALCKRSRDADTHVRDACAETIGELARLACSAEGVEGKVDDTTAELDASTLQDGPSLGAFFRPILQAMESADSHHQQGCALALAHVVFNAGPKVHPHVEKLTKRILPILDNSHFHGRPQLLITIANIIEVCPEGFEPLLAGYMPRIRSASMHSEWNTRKHAMETIETMATRLTPSTLLEHKDDILDLLEKCKYDKMRPVRDAASQAMQAALGIEGFVKRTTSNNVDDAEEEAADENTEPGLISLNASSSSAASQLHASPAQRTPMQALKPAALNRAANKELDVALKLSESAHTGVSSLPAGVHGRANSSFSSSQHNGEQLPSKEAWDQLLRHFERMTLQQTQLIEMVSGFSESARERLETVEQKVFAIELRLSSMENRQSLPGLPPTPSRAHVTPSRQPPAGTPSRLVPALQLPAFQENTSP